MPYATSLQKERYSGPTPQKETRNARPVSRAATGYYFIQSGVFARRANADRVKAELTLLGIDQVSVRQSRSSSSTQHRALIGPFHSYSIAAAKGASLEAQGYLSIVFSKK